MLRCYLFAGDGEQSFANIAAEECDDTNANAATPSAIQVGSQPCVGGQNKTDGRPIMSWDVRHVWRSVILVG